MALEEDSEKVRKQLAKLGLHLGKLDETVVDAEQHFKESMGKLTEITINGVINGFLSAGKAAMSTGDAFAMATTTMTNNVETLNQGFQVGSQSMITAGKSMIESGQKYGKSMMIGGQILGAFSSALAEVTKTGIDFMMKQTTQLIAGFQQLGSVGAVYAGGIEAATKTALEAGTTMEQFSKIVSSNKDTLLQTGLGMANGAKKLAEVMKAGTTTARDGMFALGMNMEEQGAAYAATMSRLAGPMGKLTVSSATVAELTEKYARELKLVSDITGKSAEQQQRDAAERSNALKMQQELAKMDPIARDNFYKALGEMDEASAKAMKDRIAHQGAVTDSAMAAAEAMSPALKAMHEEQFKLMQAGKLDAETDLSIRKKYSAQMQEELKNQSALGTAAEHGGTAGAIGDIYAKQMQENQKLMDANIEARAKEIKDQQTLGKEGKDTVAGLQAAQQNTAVQLQTIANKHLGEFGKALEDTVKQMEGAMTLMANGGSTFASMMSGWTGMIVSTLASVAAGAIPALFSKGMMGGGGGGGGGKGPLASALGGVTEAIGGGGGGAAGGGIGAGLKSLSSGLASLANPATLVGLAAVTAAFMGFGKALQWAAPGLEALGNAFGRIIEGVGTAISTIFKGMAESMVTLSAVNPMTLLKLAPGIAALGVAMLPFGAGGALAGLLLSGGGFDTVVAGIENFQKLDPVQLNAVAGAMKRLNDNMPSATDLLKYTALKGVESIFGGGKGATTTTGGTTAPAAMNEDSISKLVMLTEENLRTQREMLRYMRDHKDISQKILQSADF